MAEFINYARGAERFVNMADFFLGITLPEDFTEEVESLRRRFAAPRTRPHITLIPPFKWSGSDQDLETVIHDSLQGCSPFKMTCKGLGRFGRAVIFIDVVASPELMALYSKLKEGLSQEGIGDRGKDRPYHPHITLATRLSSGEFHQYVEELGDYLPTRDFLCREVALFKMQTQGRFRRWQVAKKVELG
ncbi:MAG: 2'-5' RNA ligase family protein [Firmicutes bacterium]|jgi:2'-5' RNA ligase|nr:2'-5' RNA ligase family protein [Bacillota bacterium]